ncbi:hypothetical protein LVJ83_08770 [Uruburuella testudinis]|uniref:GtrA-like protein n=1 Tax=Uruburuella testudinis TaxID=1282863 RepID=A0ABY4DR23_9NEIS|nr:hypothetical protein [Uruburuella testudinis]UOO81067.1 hypothetical protein LVJ83_08770 [Uruburuella testudinis]
MNTPHPSSDNQLRKNAAVAVFALSLLINLAAAALFNSHSLAASAGAVAALLLNAVLAAALLRLFKLIHFDADRPELVVQRCVLLAVLAAITATPAALLAAWLAADLLCAPIIQLAVLALAYVFIRRLARQRLA